MPNLLLRRYTALILSLIPSIFTGLYAQKAGLEVTRTSAIERELPVMNVAVDASGRTWASNRNGVYHVKATDFSNKKNLAAGEMCVLSYKGGNADFVWSEETFKNFVKTECSVTAAWYDEKNTILWVGTDEAGLFQFKTVPQLQLVEHFTSSNSKLKSDNVTVIFQDKSGRLWIGTDRGLTYGMPGKWKADFTGYEILRIREYGSVIYVLADGEISLAPNGEKWSDLPVNTKQLEGQIADFDIDKNGKMWIVSGVLTRFDLLAETYDIFSGPEYYTSQYGSCIAVDQDAAAWIGTEDKGLYQVDKASTITLNAYVEQPISCSGNGKDAMLRAKITGGVPPYTYQWTGGLTGENPQNVGPGTYSVTVTDSKGKFRNAEVPVPDSRLKIKTRQKKPVSAPGQSDAVAEVDIESNASGLLIRWDNGETMAVATKLGAGTHNVTVTDPKGCSASASITIADKILPLEATISEKTGIKCAGDKTAALTVKVNGGKEPYKYTWSNPALVDAQPENLRAGNYQLTVTDASGAKTTVGVAVKEPEALSMNAQVQSPAGIGAADGKAIAQAKGGSGVYLFKWDNGETAFGAVKLAAGRHTVVVTDANGCTASATVDITENILPLAVGISEKNKIKCAGEQSASLVAQVTGGKGPFKYTWSNPALRDDQPANVPAGDFQLTVTDATGASSTAGISIRQPEPLTVSITPTAPASTGNSDGKALAQTKGGSGSIVFKWDNAETSASAAKLAPGQHTLTVTDANGCTATAGVNISENILPLSVNITESSKIKCAGERSAALAVQIAGGKGPFRFNWSAPALSGEQPANVPAGDFHLTVTDAAGASSTASISVSQPQPLDLTAEVQAPASTGNADGKAGAKASGGAGAFQYKWDNGETGAAAAKLPPGKRTVTVTDANGCTASTSVEIVENIQPLTASISEKIKIKCAGEKSSVIVKVSGGKPPYSYNWNNPALRDAQADNLDAGNYSATVTDALGTTQTVSLSVSAPEPLSAELVRNMGATTDRSNDGKAQVSVKGGTGAYQIVWDTKQTGTAVSKLAMGKHAVTVTDANGCSQKIDFETEKRILPELTGSLESGQVIRMRLLNFDTDQSSLKPDALPMLDELYDFMMENGSAAIEVGGHTNNLPSDAFADELSAARAKSVADYLFGKGIDPKRVIHKGYGKRFPLVPNTSAEGRKTNQRVEIKILKIKD